MAQLSKVVFWIR